MLLQSDSIQVQKTARIRASKEACMKQSYPKVVQLVFSNEAKASYEMQILLRLLQNV